MALGNSDNFDLQRLSVLICQDCMYIKIFIILGLILSTIGLIAFIQSQHDNRLTVDCVKNLQIIFLVQNNLPLQTKVNCFISFNLLKPTCYVMYHRFNIQQLYALPILYLCVLNLSQNKQRLLPLTA